MGRKGRNGGESGGRPGLKLPSYDELRQERGGGGMGGGGMWFVETLYTLVRLTVGDAGSQNTPLSSTSLGKLVDGFSRQQLANRLHDVCWVHTFMS